MPFQSEKQRKYLHANHPEIAKRWERDYANGGISNLFKLKEGGRTGFFKGAQADTASGKSMSPGTSASGGSRSGGDGGYQTVHDTGAVTQTPGRTTTPDKGDGVYQDRIIELADRKRKSDLKDIVAQGEKTEKWEKAQKWTKPSTSSKIIGGLITLATMGVLGPGAAKAAKYYGYYNKAKKVQTALKEGKVDIFGKEIKLNAIGDKLKSSDQKLMESLPKGHPERIALEAQMKVRTPPKHDGDGATTSIKIEDIETVNDANAEQVQLKKYREMELASYRAMIQQQEDRSKQMAYWKQMMAPYMSAQGGRVPGGYNTGGLSNLFRLKNV